jgi:protein CpxP
MNRMFLPATLALIFTGSLAFAQNQAPSPQPDSTQAPIVRRHAPNPTHQAAKQLNLTPDQTARIEPIFADRDQKIAALQSDPTLTPDARQQQMKSIRKTTNQQVRAVLTPDQLSQMRSLHQKGHQSQPMQPAAPAPGA